MFDEPSDNILWENVLYNNDIISCETPVTIGRGIVHCKMCMSEVVHVCIEDTLLVPKGPASMLIMKVFQVIINKRR